jgi:hypothetical protein
MAIHCEREALLPVFGDSQAPTTPTAATIDYLTSGCSGHASPKTVLIVPLAAVGLIGAFQCTPPESKGIYSPKRVVNKTTPHQMCQQFVHQEIG